MITNIYLFGVIFFLIILIMMKDRLRRIKEISDGGFILACLAVAFLWPVIFLRMIIGFFVEEKI